MDLMEAAKLAGYEPYTQEFDQIVDIEEILPLERIAQARGHLEAYRRSDKQHVIDFVESAETLRDRLKEQLDERGIEPSELTVAFLVDGSGSTRGGIAYNMAMSTIEHCLAYESLGVETSVMGYTTSQWKGGDSRRKWIADGRPLNPGRLCDIQHIVYKRPDMDMDFAFERLCALAVNETKRENVDGEAIMWASQNLGALDRPRKILVNITDGSTPIDDSTIHSNNNHLLADHLMTTLVSLEETGEISTVSIYVDLNEGHRSLVDSLNREGTPIFKRHTIAEGKQNAQATLAAVTEGMALALDHSLELVPSTPASRM